MSETPGLIERLGDHAYRSYNEPLEDDLLAAARAIRELVEGLRLCLPKNVCLTNPRWNDATVLPCDVLLGDLRRMDALITKYQPTIGRVE